MALFTVEADGKPICTFAADDIAEAGQMAEVEREEWTEIGAFAEEANVSVRQANLGEALLWKEVASEAIEDGAVETQQEAEESIVAFHVPVADDDGDDEDDDDFDEAEEDEDEGADDSGRR